MIKSEFDYSPWRHGGWYVNNVRYPTGAIGCVSRNYDDRKWRIACDPRPFEQRPTFANRDAAARGERDMIATLSAAFPSGDWTYEQAMTVLLGGWLAGPRVLGLPSWRTTINGVQITVKAERGPSRLAAWRCETADGFGKASDTIEEAKSYAPFLAAKFGPSPAATASTINA